MEEANGMNVLDTLYNAKENTSEHDAAACAKLDALKGETAAAEREAAAALKAKDEAERVLDVPLEAKCARDAKEAGEKPVGTKVGMK